MSQQEEVALPATPIKTDSKDAKRISSDSESVKDTASTNGQETFEDAVDTASMRSLTARTLSPSKPQTPIEEKDEKTAHRGSQESQNKEQKEAEDHKDEEDNKKDNKDRPQSTDSKISHERPTSPEKESEAASYRFSSTSVLDNVNLDEDHLNPEPKSPQKDQQPARKISISNISNVLPAMPWSPSNDSPSKSPVVPPTVVSPPPQAHSPPPPPPTRKLTNAFSWLSRGSSSKDKEKEKEKEPHPSPPPLPSTRRNTASSIATLTSNPEMMLSRLEEEKEGSTIVTEGVMRNSLKARFKQLRIQEENSPQSPGDVQSPGLTLVLPRNDVSYEKPLPSPVPSPSPSLAPGTASGVNAGPSSICESQVDWDLWQSVVYEGPTAVARTSAEELNRAIATGIPSAIRGVIWQVLASSKNEELEVVYKELCARGTDKDKNRHSNGTTTSSLSNGNLSVHSGDAVNSSASSVTSDYSGHNGAPSPSPNEKNVEAIQKAQAAAVAERKKKEKEDSVMLQKLEKTIRRDLGARTSYSKYAAASGLQEGLFGVCKAYALFDEGVGYAQGMNFLIMPLLFNMPEQEAFSLLVRLMNHYQLRDLFIQDMPGLHMRLYQFERLLEDLEPALYCHLHRRGISSHLYATQWFLTLFAYRFPLQLVLRIYDLILSEGLSAILRFGIVLMQKNAATLLEISDMQQLTTYLKDKLFDVYIDDQPSHGSLLENGFFGSSSASGDKEVYHADQFVRDACEVKMTPELLKNYTTEWEEKTQAEKDRENELYEYRTGNQKLAIKVRKLEERVEACDREQTDLANELIHTKIQNEELKDENESMRGQVRELRVVIEKQPIEIEETWNLERDDLMKRNGKVHEENQRLEKEMAELEEELVQTKMRYAEINSQHEALNRKWADLKRQFA